MKIENIDKNQFLEIDFLYEFDWYKTYNITWKNNFFSGKSTICFNNEKFNNFKNNILKLKVLEIIKIFDNDSDWYIEIKKLDWLWHYNIYYQIWWEYQDNYCKLILNTDLIWITKFIKDI